MVEGVTRLLEFLCKVGSSECGGGVELAIEIVVVADGLTRGAVGDVGLDDRAFGLVGGVLGLFLSGLELLSLNRGVVDLFAYC